MKVITTLTAAALFGATVIACGTKTTVNNANDVTAAGHNGRANMTANMPAGSHGNMMHSGEDPKSMQSSANAASAPYDLQFIDTMTAHHQAAVDMAVLAAKRAGHTEVKSLAADIMINQLKENSDMKMWRDKWFPGASPAVNMEMAGMHESMKGMDMASLSALSGNDFDLAFVQQMTPHHEGAVMMAREALQKAAKPEIKKLAEAIIKAQETEIKNMKEWQAAWQR
jgi:uncharacterized protein (DUF305 family)